MVLVTESTRKQFNRCRRVRDRFLALAQGQRRGHGLANYLRSKNRINQRSINSVGRLVIHEKLSTASDFLYRGADMINALKKNL